MTLAGWLYPYSFLAAEKGTKNNLKKNTLYSSMLIHSL